MIEERINELEDRTIEIASSEQQRENNRENWKEMRRTPGTYGTVTKDLIFFIIRGGEVSMDKKLLTK